MRKIKAAFLLMRAAWRDEPPMTSVCEMPSMARVTGEGPALAPRLKSAPLGGDA